MDIYRSKIDQYTSAILKLDKDLYWLSVIRLVAFIGSIAIVAILVRERAGALVSIAIPLCIFGYGLVLNRYNRVDYTRKHTVFLKELNEEELVRLNNKLSGFPTGQAYANPAHSHVSDLDIFGPHSLFQLLNRTTTESGHIRLAEWLSEPASAKDVILERQRAIKELTGKVDWRQDFQASGMHFRNPKSDYNRLLAWIEKPAYLLPRRSAYLVAGILLSASAILAAVYSMVHAFSPDYSYYTIFLNIILLINHFTLRSLRPVSEEIINSTYQNIQILAGFQSLITKIESSKFDSPMLERLQSTFRQTSYSAAGEFSKLKKILDVFKLRGTRKGKSMERNLFYGIFNIFFLLDIYWIILVERWRVRNKDYVRSWASSVSEFEVLNSIAGFSYSNPGYAFPEIKEEDYIIRFEMLGHPLINAASRVSNDFSLVGRGRIVMITGSNMAGKSTFLRAVGVNLVLALMGAPCCARSAQVSNMKLFTSMRTQDNLEEGISSFYAELKRVEQLLKLLESGEAVFFLLDEMFKGTNSQDRHKGGISLIKQLSELNAFGLISTHDLELAKRLGNHMINANYSFNSEIHGDEMTFNYQLTEGICQDFNASELMKRSGIKVLSNIDEFKMQ
jgi:hypothetical protein